MRLLGWGGDRDVPDNDWLDNQPLSVHASEVEHTENYRPRRTAEYLTDTDYRPHSRH